MVNSQVGFVIKVLLLSAVLSVGVKYGGRFLPLSPTSVNALLIVLLPLVIVSLLLGWRAKNFQ